MNDSMTKMWLVTGSDRKLFLRVYGDRESIDVALKTWWQYYHSRGVVVEEFAVWVLSVTVTHE